jgi:YjbE family integral membrane protein
MDPFFNTQELISFFQIIAIDLVMSGDNAIIIGMAAASLPPDLRRKAIVYGIMGAAILRIIFAGLTVHLLAIIGLTLAGGLLLAWVCWRMWQELRSGGFEANLDIDGDDSGDAESDSQVTPNLRRACMNIVIADLSMSLDNVLAVAGAAKDHLGILIFGLVLSIALMAFASTLIARVLEKHHWISYLGLVIIVYVAGDMIWRGGFEVHTHLLSQLTP